MMWLVIMTCGVISSIMLVSDTDECESRATELKDSSCSGQILEAISEDNNRSAVSINATLCKEGL